MTAILVKYGLYAVLALAAIVGTAIAWQIFVAAPYRAQGDARTTAKLAPQIAQLDTALTSCRADNATLSAGVQKLQASINEANSATDALQAAQQQAQARANAAETAARQAKTAQAATIAKLVALTAGVPSADSCTGICADARSILADLARARRVQ